MDTQIIKKTAVGSFYSFSGIIFSRVANMISIIIISRVYGSHWLGVYSLSFTVFMIAEIFGSVGINQGGMRFLSIEYGRDDKIEQRRVVASSMTLACFFGLAASILTYIFSDVIAEEVFSESSLGWVLKITAFAVPCAVITRVGSFLSRGLHTTKYDVFVTCFIVPCIFLFLVVTCAIGELGFRGIVLSFAISRVAGSIAIIVILLRWFRAEVMSLWRFAVKKRSNSLYRKILRYSYPFVIIELVTNNLNTTIILVLGIYLESSTVGEFTVASRVAVLMLLSLQATNRIFSPMVASIFAEGKYSELRQLYCTITRWLLVAGVPALFFIYICSSEVMVLFGSTFTLDGPRVLIILTTGTFFNLSTGGVGPILSMTGRQRLELGNTLCFGVLGILLNIAMVSSYGVLGSAIAATGATVMINLARVTEVWYLYGVQPFNRYHAIVYAIAGVTIWLCLKNWILRLPYTTLTNMFLGLLFCLILIGILGFTSSNSDERRFLRRIKEWI